MAEPQRIQDKQWSRIIAKAWADDTIRDRLLSDPKAVLSEQGFETSREVRVSMRRNRADAEPKRSCISSLPPKPGHFGRRVAAGGSGLLLLRRMCPLRSLRLRLRSVAAVAGAVAFARPIERRRRFSARISGWLRSRNGPRPPSAHTSSDETHQESAT